MNVLSDFTLRLNVLVPINENEAELAKLRLVIDEKTKKLEEAESELGKLRKPIATAKKPPKKAVKESVLKPKTTKKAASK